MSIHGRYYGVQALRGFAALSVALFHAAMFFTMKMPENINGQLKSSFLAGAGGVDIFFAISGFVIVFTSAPDWGKSGGWKIFMQRRIVRIVPLYWLMTIAMLGLLCVPSLSHHDAHLTPWYIASSFFFIPDWNANHEAYPVVGAGWTLSFEMMFYIVFAVAMTFSRRPVMLVSSLFTVLAFVGIVFPTKVPTKDWGAPMTLISPLLLEFVFGMWIGAATLQGRYLPVRVALWLAPLAVLVMWATCPLPLLVAYAYRVIIWGIPGAILLASIVALEPLLSSRAKGLPNLLGDASYAIYLIHGFVVSIINIILDRIPGGNNVPHIPLFALAVVCSAAAGVVLHLYIEKPMTRRLHKVINERRSASELASCKSPVA